MHGRNNNYTLEKILERRNRALIRKTLEREHQHRVTSKEIDLANLALKHPEQRFIILTFLTVDLDAYCRIVPLCLSPSHQLKQLPELESDPNSNILQIEMSNDKNAPDSSKPTTSRVILPYYILADKSESSVLADGSGSAAGSSSELLLNDSNNNNNASKNVSDKSARRNPRRKGKKKKKHNKKKGKEENSNPTRPNRNNPGSSSSPVESSPIDPACTDLREKSDTDDAPSWTSSVSDRCADVSGSNSDVSDNDELALSPNKPGPTAEELNVIVQSGAKLEIITIDRADCSVDASTSNGFLPVASGRRGRRKLTGQTGNSGRVLNGFNGKNRFSVWQEKGKNNTDKAAVIKEQQPNKSSNKTEIWVRSKEGPKINSSKPESGKLLKSDPKPDTNQGFNFRRGRQASKKNNSSSSSNNNNNSSNNNNNNNNNNSGSVVIEQLRNPVFKKDDFPSLPLSSKGNSKAVQKRRGNARPNEKLTRGATWSRNQCETPVEKSGTETQTQIQNPNLEIETAEAEQQSGSETQIQTEIQNPSLEIEAIGAEEESESVIQSQNPNLEIEAIEAEKESESEILTQTRKPNLAIKTIEAEEESESETLTQTQNPNLEIRTIEAEQEPESESESESETRTEAPNPNFGIKTNETEEQSGSRSSSSSNSPSSDKNETNESNHDTCPSDNTHKNNTTNESDAFGSYSSSSACSSPASIAPISPVIDLPCFEIGETIKTLIVSNTDLDQIKAAVLASLRVQSRVQAFNNGGLFADYERFLHCTSPVLGQFPLLNPSCNCTGADEYNYKYNNAIYCCHQIPKIPLRKVWQWYEEPGCYGLEVRGHDQYSCMDFKAHFAPYLSAVQLFVWPDAKKETESEIEMESELASLPIFSKLLPKQSKEVEGNGSETRPVSQSGSDKKGCGELAFEFFESEQPHYRLTVFEKIKQLIGGVKLSKGQFFGDPLNLESMLLKDLHPSSWYSIAWYPAYRVPEGQFKVAFLTYHSLGHFVQQGVTPINCGPVSVSLPVVGLQYYNDKGESWFEVRNQNAKVGSSELMENLSELVRERLSSLNQTSSIMARAKVSKNGEISMNHHGDFEFFRSRSRPLISIPIFN